MKPLCVQWRGKFALERWNAGMRIHSFIFHFRAKHCGGWQQRTNYDGEFGIRRWRNGILGALLLKGPQISDYRFGVVIR